MSGFVAQILMLVIRVEQRLRSDSQTGSSRTAVVLSGFQCRCGLKAAFLSECPVGALEKEALPT